MFRLATLIVSLVAVTMAGPGHGLPLPDAQAPLPPPDAQGAQRTWQVHVMPPPEGADVDVAMAQALVLVDGLRGPVVLGPRTGADIVIHWVDELRGGERLGQYVLGTERVEIAVGDSQCGAWTPYDTQTLTWVLAHEMGHAMGLDHQDGTWMDDKLPVTYANDCFASGHVRLLPMQTFSLHLHVADGAIVYDISSTRSVDVCITPADATRMAGWGCQRGRELAAEVALPPGAYSVAIRCASLLGCSVDHTVGALVAAAD